MSATPPESSTQASASPFPAPLQDEDPVRASKRLQRERERQERLRGKLTDLTFADISCLRNGKPAFMKSGVLACIQGSKSQFDARVGRMVDVLPPLTSDCCQTFSTLSAILLSSLGFAAMLSECCNISTVNYLLYISAWMHQLTQPCWPQRRERPTIGDLNECLHLRDYFPSKASGDEFEIVFYNQGLKAIQLLDAMCTSRKRARAGEEKHPVYGYVIVSGDYTVSVFAVDHDIARNSKSRYREAWSFYICDSHGTQPWSEGKASVSGLTFGHRAHAAHNVDGAEGGSSRAKSLPTVSVEDGIHYFSTILFILLEEHRKGAQRSNQTPYMTWTPLRRRRSMAFTADEMCRVIDTHWIPKVLSNPVVRAEAKKFFFAPLRCFWGIDRATTPCNSLKENSKGAPPGEESKEKIE